MKRKLLALLLALCLTLGVTPAFADEAQVQPLPAWSNEVLADGLALGLMSSDITTTHSSIVTMEQVEAMSDVVANKLALLDLPLAEASEEALVLDTTRGGVVNALYQAVAAYEIEGIDQAPADYMVSIGVLEGDEGGLNLERDCTVLEAATMAVRLVLAIYDQCNAGSLGLLWKATSAAGDTLYLLGSIHTDVNNTYPFHKQLRDVIENADEVIFELNFNDTAQLAEFAAMQIYSDGTTLADHISPELYEMVVSVCAQLGLDEQTVSMYKAWALASTLQTLAIQDDTTSSNALAVDLYINQAAVCNGASIEAAETYAFQGGIFDGLSPEYQEQYLAVGVLMCMDVNSMTEEQKAAIAEILGEEALEPEYLELLAAQDDAIAGLMDTWKNRDVAGFETAYNKEAIIESDDELNSKLFTERDPGMIAYAQQYMDREGVQNGLMVVGAGHMVGDGGIVAGLRNLGYTVELVAQP